jgi:hypothetical protein
MSVMSSELGINGYLKIKHLVNHLRFFLPFKLAMWLFLS